MKTYSAALNFTAFDEAANLTQEHEASSPELPLKVQTTEKVREPEETPLTGSVYFEESKHTKSNNDQAQLRTAQPKITGQRKSAKKGAMTSFMGVQEANQTATTKAETVYQVAQVDSSPVNKKKKTATKPQSASKRTQASPIKQVPAPSKPISPVKSGSKPKLKKASTLTSVKTSIAIKTESDQKSPNKWRNEQLDE